MSSKGHNKRGAGRPRLGKAARKRRLPGVRVTSSQYNEIVRRSRGNVSGFLYELVLRELGRAISLGGAAPARTDTLGTGDEQ